MDELVKAEKVSVNMNISTLSQIDLLVDYGFYSNRSDFINQAVRECLSSKNNTIERIINQNTMKDENGNELNHSKGWTKVWFVGLHSLTKEYIEKAVKEDKKITVSGYGLLVIDKDFDDEFVIGAIEKIKVRGKVMCSDAVKKHFML